ncbi:hypothetical protein CDL60_18960 [Roseateles noduli]|nr:hypothetical protein CDL60_18960 [Roseateles noduli]
MSGLIITAAALAAIAFIAGFVYVLSLLLPDGNPLRMRIRAATVWIYKNPGLIEKRLKLTAFTLIIGYFFVLTIIYS